MWVKFLRPWRCRVPRNEAVSMRFCAGETRSVPRDVGELAIKQGAAEPHISPRKVKVQSDGD